MVNISLNYPPITILARKTQTQFHGVFDIYVWKDALLDGEGRFVRITVLQPGGRMYEIGFLGPDGKDTIPIQNVIQILPGHLEAMHIEC